MPGWRRQPSTNRRWSFSISRDRAPRAHRPPEAVALRRGEAGDLDGDAHDLLLVQDHAHRILEHGLERGVQVGHRLEALAAAQERVDGVALDRSGPDDRDLDDEVVEAPGLRLREGLHLGPALDLEDPDRVRGLEHGEDLGTSSGSRSRSRHTAQSCWMSWRVSSIAASIPSPSRSSLMSLSVSTSRLSNWTTTRSGIVARSIGAMSMSGAAVTSIPPAVDRQVAREAVDARAELEPALPVAEADRRAAAGLRRRLRLDAGDASSSSAGRRVPGPTSTAARAGRSCAAAATAGRAPGRPARHRAAGRGRSPCPGRPGARRRWPGCRPGRPRRRTCRRPGSPCAARADRHGTARPGCRSSGWATGRRPVRRRPAEPAPSPPSQANGRTASGSSGGFGWCHGGTFPTSGRSRLSSRPIWSTSSCPTAASSTASMGSRRASVRIRPPARVVELAHRVGQTVGRGDGHRRDLGRGRLAEELGEPAVGLQVAPDHHASRTSRAPWPPGRRAVAGTPARSPPRGPPSAPGT